MRSSAVNRMVHIWEMSLMKIDTDKIDDAILALLYLTLDRDGRAWKGFQWEAMNRLREKGFIGDPSIRRNPSALPMRALHDRRKCFGRCSPPRSETQAFPAKGVCRWRRQIHDAARRGPLLCFLVVSKGAALARRKRTLRPFAA